MNPAPVVPDKPARTDVESLITGSEMLPVMTDDVLVPESMMEFYGAVEYLKTSYSGEGITVAVIDSGIDRNAASSNITSSYDFVTGSEVFEDAMGHGTRMAEVISRTASDAALMDLKVFDEDGETSSRRVAEAINYAVDMGARVLSMSFSLFPISDQLERAIDYAFDMGAILVTAAGNSSSRILEASLAAQDKVITVGSVDSDGRITAWSNYGSEIDLYAPWDVITFNDGSGDEAGTSYSAAFVSGLAALILEDNPGYTASDVLADLELLTSMFGREEDLSVSGDMEEVIPGGVSVDEVVSMYEAQRRNRAQFTGHGMVDDRVDKTTVTE